MGQDLLFHLAGNPPLVHHLYIRARALPQHQAAVAPLHFHKDTFLFQQLGQLPHPILQRGGVDSGLILLGHTAAHLVEQG